MLRFKREYFSNRSSSWIQATTPCRRTTFHQSFIPGKRYSSTNASDTARLQRSGNLKDNLPAAWSFWFAGVVCLGTIGVVEWKRSEPFRHTVHAAVRCSRVARMIILFSCSCLCSNPVDHNITGAAILGAVDYKLSFVKSYGSEEARLEAYSKCHKRSAERLLKALLANGGAPNLMDIVCIQTLRRVYSQSYRRIHKIGPTYGVIVSCCLITLTLNA